MLTGQMRSIKSNDHNNLLNFGYSIGGVRQAHAIVQRMGDAQGPSSKLLWWTLRLKKLI